MSAIDEFQKLYDGYVDRYRARDAAGCALFFTTDAELYSPYGPPAIGQSAIENTHSEWVEEGGDDKTIEVLKADLNGHVGWCLARFSESSGDYGTSLSVFEKQSDGTWLITQCSLNEGA